MVVIVLATAGCGSSDSTSGSSTTTKTDIGQPATVDRTTSSGGSTGTPGSGTTGGSKTSAGNSSTDSAPPPTTPAETAPPTTAEPTGLGTPRAAAQRLYDAWKAGDKATAATIATPEAIQGIFATAPGDYAPYNSCDSGEFDTSGCLFRGNSGTIQFNMERRGSSWVVTEALYSEP